MTTPAERPEMAAMVHALGGEDLPDIPVAPDLLVWLGGSGRVELESGDFRQAENPNTGRPDLRITLRRVVRAGSDRHMVHVYTYPEPVFKETDIEAADGFLRTHAGKAFCCPDGDFVDQTQMQTNLSLIHHAMGAHGEGRVY